MDLLTFTILALLYHQYMFIYFVSITWFFLFIFYFLNLFYWRLITLQLVVFAIHWYESAVGVYVSPILNPPPTSIPIPSLRLTPVYWPWVPCIMHQTWTGYLVHIWQYTCFNAILSNHPNPCLLPQSPKVCSLCLCLFCCLAYRVIVTIFLNSIYMHEYTVLGFFFLTYFTLYNRLQFHPPH